MDEACEISFELEILPNAEVLKPFLKQRIHHLFGLLFLHDGGDWGHLLPLGLPFLEHLARLEERERKGNCGHRDLDTFFLKAHRKNIRSNRKGGREN